MKILLTASIVVLSGAISWGSQPVSEQRDIQKWLRKKDKPVIRDIVISGNAEIKSSDITKRLYSRKRTFLRALQGDRRTRLQRESLHRDTLELQYLYLTRGFINATISVAYEPIMPDSSAKVIVTIAEGRRFTVERAIVEGDYKPQLNNELLKLTHRLKTGEDVNVPAIRQTEFGIKAVLANNGYPYASVGHRFDTTAHNATCRIIFSIRSDSLVTFGDVAVDGCRKFPEQAVLRELLFKPGDVYSREKLIQSQNHLFETGYFVSAQLQQIPSSSDRLNPDLAVRVRERKPGFATIRTGAGQSEVRDLQWDLSAMLGKRNFAGTRRVSTQAGYSFSFGKDARLIDHYYRITFTEPWFLGFRQPLTISGEYKPRLQSTVQDYDLQSWSISASTHRKFSRELTISSGVVYRSIEISNVSKELQESIRRELGISVRRNAFLDIRRDSRDDLFVPRRGSYAYLVANYFGGFMGGDEHFAKMEGSWSSYQVVWPGWISATRLKGGWAHPLGESDAVPSVDRLYLGGANSVRGFRENSLGPVADDGTALGSEVSIIMNQEFRWRTVQLLQPIPLINDLFRNIPLWQSVFIDVGNGFGSASDVTLSKMAVGYGTGIQFISPAGPIRVDYARVANTKSFDFAERWHFTILYAF